MPGRRVGHGAGGQSVASAMTPANVPGYTGTFNSANDNENQNEQNYYSVVTYQKSAGDLNYQVSAFGRESEQHFTPGPDRRPLSQRRGQRSASLSLFRRLASRRQLSNWATPIPFGPAGCFWPWRTQNNSSTTVFTLDWHRKPDGDPDQHPGQPSPLRYFRRRLCAG